MDDIVLVPVGTSEEKFNGLITTNDVGAFIWKELCDGKDEREVLSGMLEAYEVEEAVASADLKEFLSKLIENDIIE